MAALQKNNLQKIVDPRNRKNTCQDPSCPTRKRTPRSARRNTDRNRLRACLQKRLEHQAPLQNHGGLLHHARLAMRMQEYWYPLLARQGTGPRKCKIKKVFRAVGRWVKKEPVISNSSRARGTEPVAEMIRERFMAGMPRALAGHVRRNRISWRKSTHVPYKTPPKACKWEFKQAGELACQMARKIRRFT